MDNVTVQLVLPENVANALTRLINSISDVVERNNGLVFSNSTNKRTSSFISTIENTDGYVAPTEAEVTSYCNSRGSCVSGKRFWDYYNQHGWKDKFGNRIEWKEQIAKWESYNLEKKQSTSSVQKSVSTAQEWLSSQ